MTSTRVYIPVKTVEYARLWGVSTRVARSRIMRMPGAVKVGSRWQAPILASEYARRKGIRPESARRRKGALRAQNPRDLKDVVLHTDLKTLRKDAAKAIEKRVGDRREYRWYNVQERLTHASRDQLRALIRAAPTTDFWETTEYLDDSWEGEDGYSILYYR